MVIFVKAEELMLIRICLLQLHYCDMSESQLVLIPVISMSDKLLPRGLKFVLQLLQYLLPVPRRNFHHLTLEDVRV